MPDEQQKASHQRAGDQTIFNCCGGDPDSPHNAIILSCGANMHLILDARILGTLKSLTDLAKSSNGGWIQIDLPTPEDSVIAPEIRELEVSENGTMVKHGFVVLRLEPKLPLASTASGS